MTVLPDPTQILYAHLGAGRAAVLTRDAEGRDHVATVFDFRALPARTEVSDGWTDQPCVVIATRPLAEAMVRDMLQRSLET